MAHFYPKDLAALNAQNYRDSKKISSEENLSNFFDYSKELN